jgi:hypothetical protein
MGRMKCALNTILWNILKYYIFHFSEYIISFSHTQKKYILILYDIIRYNSTSCWNTLFGKIFLHIEK